MGWKGREWKWELVEHLQRFWTQFNAIATMLIVYSVCFVCVAEWKILRLKLLYTGFIVSHVFRISYVKREALHKLHWALLMSLWDVGQKYCPWNDLKDSSVCVEGFVTTTDVLQFLVDTDCSLNICCSMFNRCSRMSLQTQSTTLSWLHFLAAWKWTTERMDLHFIRAWSRDPM